MKNLQNRRGVWLSNLLLVAGLVLVAMVATLFERLFGVTVNPGVRIAVSVVVALMPPILWMLLFYGLDREEPEPKEQILKMALLGALVQKGVFSPLLAALPAVDAVSGLPKSVSAYAGLLMMVAMREILKLMTLRYGIMRHEAFNEKTDGILYGSAIGLGFSAMMNLDYVASTGGALLSAAAPQMVITSLIQASLGGLGGYWLGLSVFSRQARWRLPVSLVFLVLLSGIMQLLPAALVRQGFRVNYLIGLVPSAIAAGAIFLVLFLLIRRHGPLLKGKQGDRKTRYEGLVLGAGLFLTLASALVLQIWQDRLIPVSPIDGMTVSIPAGWAGLSEEGALFAAGDRFARGDKSGYIRAESMPDNTKTVPDITGTAPDITKTVPDITKTVPDITGTVPDITKTVPDGILSDGTQPDGTQPDGTQPDGTQLDGEEAVHQLAAWWTMKSAREAAYYQPVHTEFLFRDGQWLAVIESLRLEVNPADMAGRAPIVRRWRDAVWVRQAEIGVISLFGTEADGDPDTRLMDSMVASIRFGAPDAKGGEGQ